VAAVPGHHDDEVVGVPDQPPIAQAVPPALGPFDRRVHHVLPPPGEVVIERGQGDVGQQRGQHAPNTVGNFCFEVTLGYRRVERGR